MTGTLVVLAGLPGAGKTTLARIIARRLGAAWLRVDTVEGAMRRAGLPFEAIGTAGYDALMALAADQLANGLAVVADCVNPVEASRAGWRGVAAGAGRPILEVEVVCSDAAEHRRRVEARPDGVPGLPRVRVPTETPASFSGSLDEGKAGSKEARVFVGALTWPWVSGCGYEPWRGERLVVDTAKLSPAEAADAVLAALPERHRA